MDGTPSSQYPSRRPGIHLVSIATELKVDKREDVRLVDARSSHHGLALLGSHWMPCLEASGWAVTLDSFGRRQISRLGRERRTLL